MAIKKPTYQELMSTIIRTYLALAPIVELLRPIAVAQFGRNLERDLPPAGRRDFRKFTEDMIKNPDKYDKKF